MCATNEYSPRAPVHQRIAIRIANVNESVVAAEKHASYLRTIAAMLPPAPTKEQEEALHQFFSI